MIELNRIYNMDCVEGMRLLDDECIDLTVTSPPYDNLRTYNGYSFDFENVARQLYRVTKSGGVVVWIVGDSYNNGSESLTSFKQALHFKEIGFNVHDTMIYQKNSYPFPPTNRYYQQFEYMFVLSKNKPKTANLLRVKTTYRKKTNEISTARQKDGTTKEMKYAKGHDTRIKDNVWRVDTGYMRTTKDEYAYKHPAMFPEKLVEDHIMSWSNPNDIVLDPFMGSGTTAKMSLINKRNYIGFEISSEYCQIISERTKHVQASLLV